MISRKQAAIVSSIAVSGMLLVAWSEFNHGKSPAEVHLITSAQLTIGSTVAFNGAGYHQNAIIEAEYRAPPDTSPLQRDGVIHPTSPMVSDLRPQLTTWTI